MQALKARNNFTNWKHLARIYLVIAAALTGAVWVIEAARAGELSWWWAVPATLVAIIVIGASQHQFGGAIHEGTHYMLFANRKLNELASDWLAAFPILTTTYHFRLHHLAHHQFVNDPERDPDISQLRESDHWLDFPITHVEILWSLLKQLWVPNLFRYTITRARYSSMRGGTIPIPIPKRPGTIRPLRAGILFAVGAPLIVIPLTVMGYALAVAIILPLMWAIVVDDPRQAAGRELSAHALGAGHSASLHGHRPRHLPGDCSTLCYRRCSSPAGVRRGHTSACCGWCRCSRHSRCS